MRTVTILRKDEGRDEVNAYGVTEYVKLNTKNELWKKMKIKQKHGKKERRKYLNTPITFDIETSHYDPDGDKKKRLSFMYIWQMTIDGILVIGRTWDEWIKLLHYLHKIMRLGEQNRLIIFVHNLPYEFAFFHSRLPIDKIFAREARKPLSVELGNDLYGIEFKCTYSISSKSLAKLATDTMSCPYDKMVNDLDYNKLRTHKTILTDEEFVYCVVDVLILHYYIQSLINAEKTQNIAYIPMTSTGFCRRDCLDKVKGNKEYKKFYDNMKLDAEQFIIYNKAFRGGETHANAIWCNQKVDNVYHYDLTSSYPTRILVNEFPASKPITIHKPSIDDFNYIIENDMLAIYDIILDNVKVKGIEYFNYIPIAKCDSVYKPECDNGKIVKADQIHIVVTSVDFKIIEDNYDFEINNIISIVYHSKKSLLPKVFRDFVIELYQAKTNLKGVKGREEEYNLSKAKLNSVYGMCVTNPLYDEVWFDFNAKEWFRTNTKIQLENSDIIQESLDNNYKSRNHFLAYEVGVWISAYAREDLLKALHKLGTDCVYWDTDSCFFVGEHNLQLFDSFNKDKIEELKCLNYEMDEIAPKNKKGERCVIGLWDREDDIERFKTFGAKKYVMTINNEQLSTVAGLSKKAAKYIAEKHNGDITNVELGFEVPSDKSGRTQSIYSEDPFELEIEGVFICENSYVSIVDTTYKFGDTNEHKLYTELVQNIAQIKKKG